MKNNPAPVLIRRTLLELLKERPYQSITMGDIAGAAYIGRRTCYRYYRSKDEIMKSIVDELMDEYAEVMLDPEFKSFEDAALAHFQFFERKSGVVMQMMDTHTLHFLEERFHGSVMNIAYCAKYGTMEISPEELERIEQSADHYEFTFKMAGFWQMTMLWLRQGMRFTPKEMLELTKSNLTRMREELYF